MARREASEARALLEVAPREASELGGAAEGGVSLIVWGSSSANNFGCSEG